MNESPSPQPQFATRLPSWPPAWPEIHDALRAVWVAGDWGKYHGSQTVHVEQLISKLVRQEYVRLCSSGTIAVELALRAIGVGVGDEVILAAYDFPGNFRSIEFTGAKPVLVDLDPATGCLCAAQLPEAKTAATKAVLVSHLHSGLADMPEICEWSSAAGIAVIEDACQAPGAEVHGRPAGSWGDICVLSFGGSKLLTAGRGGAVGTSREDYRQRMTVYAERGNDAFPMSQLQACVLPCQLQRLAGLNQRRRSNARRLLSRLKGQDGLSCVAAQDPRSHPSYYKFSIWLEGPLSELRDEWLSRLQSRSVAIDAGFRGFFRRSPRRCRAIGDLPHSRLAAAGGTVLHHPMLLLDEEGIDELADLIGNTTNQMLETGN